MKDLCISCKVSLINNKGATRFLCPNCGKYEITRCGKCREIVAKYVCPECGFEGPN
ncbi:MAG: zinc finger domain-containing protein [Candidatus Woesearchaeota archaeon]